MPEALETHAIEGELTISSVGAHAPALAAAVAHAGSCHLDLSGVTHVDGAGLQLLMFGAREAARSGGSLHVAAASRAVVAALSIARLGADLQPCAKPAFDGAEASA